MDYPLIPAPAHLEPGGGAFTITPSTTIRISDPDDAELRALGAYAVGLLQESIGVELQRASEAARSGAEAAIALTLSPEIEAAEGYRLRATPRSVQITASAHAGLFYGLQTLAQLLQRQGGGSSTESVWEVPAVTIEDEPRFSYRGMHLDVGRHFFPVSFIKRYIDLMAMYKMNTFHWHLTEDQGWRIEIEKYPRLTEVGACRDETILEKNFDPYIGDGVRYCGFYTQDEVREVVAYAASRYVDVIPEIELPGHSTAALAAYPELACTDGPFEVSTRWGVHEDIYCPKEETFAFLEDVLTEVMELFPSRYIHIGGDEAPKRRWEESEVAQAVIRREGSGRRARAAELLHQAHRVLLTGPRSPADRLGRDPGGRPGAAGDGHVVARHGGRNRGGPPGPRRHHDADQPRLLRLLPGPPRVRAAGDRRLHAAGEGLRVRARAR